MFDDLNESGRIDRAIFIGLTAESHKGIKCVLLITGSLKLLLLCNNFLELVLGDLACVVRGGLCNHAVNLLICRLLPHHLQHYAQLLRVNVPTVILVEGGECFVALPFLIRVEAIDAVFVSLSIALVCHFTLID